VRQAASARQSDTPADEGADYAVLRPPRPTTEEVAAYAREWAGASPSRRRHVDPSAPPILVAHANAELAR